MRDFLESIQGFVDQIRQPIREGHASTVSEIQASVQAFQECADGAADEKAAIDNLRDDADLKSQTHITCRIAEANNTAGQNSCEAERVELTARMEAACSLVNESFPNCPAQTEVESDSVYLDRLLSYVEGRESAENTFIAACTAAQAAFNAHVCEHPQPSACVAEQTALESATCSWAAQVASNCTSYKHCFTRKENAHSAVVSQANTAMADRKKEWQVVEHIHCLINAKINDTSDQLDAAKITACKESSIDTSEFDLTFPAVPDVMPCTATVTKPCDQAYTDAQYVQPFANVTLIGNAVFADLVTLAPCNPCPPPVPSAAQMAEDASQAIALSVVNSYEDSKHQANASAQNALLQANLKLYPKLQPSQPLHVHSLVEIGSARLTNGLGTADVATPCKLPFTYQGKVYHECLGTGHGGYGWCATGSFNYEDTEKWGGCTSPGTRA
jgi:hypothetical protein